MCEFKITRLGHHSFVKTKWGSENLYFFLLLEIFQKDEVWYSIRYNSVIYIILV